MRKLSFVTVFYGLLGMVLILPAAAQNCSSAPTGFGGAWWVEYAKWCTQCGGTPNVSTTSCTPGPNWGKTQTSSSVNSTVSGVAFQSGYQLGQGIGKFFFGDPAAKLRAEQDRQQVMQSIDQMLRQQAAEQAQALQFAAYQAHLLDDQQRNDVLSNMRGIPQPDDQLTLRPSTSFFGIPGNPTGSVQASAAPPAPVPPPTPPPTGDSQCQWGDQESSAVDLRCLGLDPDKPIVMDPHVVRGQERVFPAQIDPATFENENYNNGFSALMRPTDNVKDALDAVSYFQIAKLQRPDDPMVRNGLALAQDILKGRQQKAQDDKAQAEQQLYHGVAALLLGDLTTARDSVERARKLDPTSSSIGDWSMTMAAMSASFKTPGRDVKTVEMLVGNALASESSGNYAAEVNMMEMAKSLAPGDKYVAAVLAHARALAAEFPVHNAIHPAP